MAALGNVGFCQQYYQNESALNTWQTRSGLTNYHVNITATTGFPGAVAILMTNATYVDKVTIDSGGVFHFYDYDDTNQFPYVIDVVDPKIGARGEIWQATVTAGVVTITRVFSSQRGGSYAFT